MALLPRRGLSIHVNSHLCPNCHGHTHTSTALFPFAQANTYRERLSIKGLWGEGRGSVQGKVSASKGWASALLLQSTQACPGLLGVGSDGWGVKGSQWVGRHKRHVLRDRKPVTVAAASVLCILCSQTFGAEKGLCPARGEAGLRSSRHLTHIETCSELTSSEGVACGRTSVRLAVRQMGSAVLSCPSGLPRA